MGSNQCKVCGAAAGKGKNCPQCKKEAHKAASRLYHATRRKERRAKGLCTKCGQSKKFPKSITQYIKEQGEPELVELINIKQIKESSFCYRCYIARKVIAFKKRQEKERLNPTPKLTPEEQEAKRKEQVLIAGRKRRAKIRAENPNVCGHCLKRDRAEGKSWCQFCLDKASKINNTRIKKRKKASKCIICKKPSNGKQLCSACSEIQKQYSKKWWQKVKQEREESGICVRCGINKVGQDKKSCDDCLNKIKIYTQSKVRICPQCNKNELKFKQKRCDDCKEANRIEKNKRSTARKKAKALAAKKAKALAAKKAAAKNKKTNKKTATPKTAPKTSTITPEAEKIKNKPKPAIESTILPTSTMFANNAEIEDDEF